MSAAPQGSLAEVLLELQSLRQQQAREYSSLWQKLCNVEEAMQAWTKNAHAAAPAAAVHLNGRAVVHAPGQADAALAQGQPSPVQMHPFSQQLAEPSKQPAPPSPWIAVEHLRPDVAEKMHLLGGSQGDAFFSDGAAREQEPTFEPRRTLWWWARQVLWDRLLMPHEKNVWDIYICLLLVWVCFGTPVVICFGLDSKFWKGHPLGIVQLIVDLSFLTDMYLNFRTAYIDKRGNLVTNRRRIAKAYLSKWLLPDLISVLPLHFFLGSWSELTTLIKLLRVIRFAKILRLFKAYRSQQGQRMPLLIEWFEMRLDKSLLSVFIAISSVLVALHLSACMFYYMAFLKGLGPNTWVFAYGLDPAAPLWTKYLNSVYWATTTITTVGYGDITPKTAAEKMVAMPLMILGVNLLGYITSSITNIVQIRNATEKQIETKKQMVRLFIKERNIPRDLATRVTYFFHHLSLNEVRAEEKQIVEELPPKLRSRVLNYMYEDTIHKVPALQGQHPDLLAMIVSNLRLEYHTKGDIVSCQGDPPQGMYFIGEGRLEVRTYEVQDQQDSALLLSATTDEDLTDWPWQLQGFLHPPGFWGQTSAMAGLPAPATVVACSFCELFLLPIDELTQVRERFPEMDEVLDPYRLPEVLRHNMAGTIKRGQVLDEDPTFIMCEYPSLATERRDQQEQGRKSAMDRLSGLLTSLARPSAHPSKLARPSNEPTAMPNLSLSRRSRNPLARPSNSMFGPTLARPSVAASIGRPSMQALDRSSLAALRRMNQLHHHASRCKPGHGSPEQVSRSSSFSQLPLGTSPSARNSLSREAPAADPSQRGTLLHSRSMPAREDAAVDVEMGQMHGAGLDRRHVPFGSAQQLAPQQEQALRAAASAAPDQPPPLMSLNLELPKHVMTAEQHIPASPSRLARRSLASEEFKRLLQEDAGADAAASGPSAAHTAAAAMAGPSQAAALAAEPIQGATEAAEPSSSGSVGDGSHQTRRPRTAGAGSWLTRTSMPTALPSSSEDEGGPGARHAGHSGRQPMPARVGEASQAPVGTGSGQQQQQQQQQPVIRLSSSDEESGVGRHSSIFQRRQRANLSFLRRPLNLSPVMSASSPDSTAPPSQFSPPLQHAVMPAADAGTSSMSLSPTLAHDGSLLRQSGAASMGPDAASSGGGETEATGSRSTVRFGRTVGWEDLDGQQGSGPARARLGTMLARGSAAGSAGSSRSSSTLRRGSLVRPTLSDSSEEDSTAKPSK